MTERWLPTGFQHPTRVELIDGLHLRPIRASDIEADWKVVTENQPMLWETYGEAWQWPPTWMTREQDEADLARHAQEMVDHVSFNYAILSADESQIFGCVYIDQTGDDEIEHDAEVSWWISRDGSPALRAYMEDFVPAWLASAWPLSRVRYPFNGL